jgi:hypothetical protein
MSVVWPYTELAAPPNTLLAELDAGGALGIYVEKGLDYNGGPESFYASMSQKKPVNVQVMELDDNTCELRFKAEYEVRCVGIVEKQDSWNVCRQIFYLDDGDYTYEVLMVAGHAHCECGPGRKRALRQLILRKYIRNCGSSERELGWPLPLSYGRA